MMNSTLTANLMLAAALVLGTHTTYAQVQPSNTDAKLGQQKKEDTAIKEIYSDKSGEDIGTWANLLTDTGAASISAAGILGISGESISTVDSLRDLAVSLKGLSTDGEGATLAIALTPGRTGFSPIGLTNYAMDNYGFVRLLSNITLGYAQGDTNIEGVGFERRAVSIETSLVFDRMQELAVAYPLALRNLRPNGEKRIAACETLQGTLTERDEAASAATAATKKAEGAAQAPPTAQQTPAPPYSSIGDGHYHDKPLPPEHPLSKEIAGRATECGEAVKASLRWNAARMSVAYGEGWIRAKDKGQPEESMGRTLAVSLAYGFEGLPGFLRDHAQLSATYRRTNDEPVLESLDTGTVAHKDTELLVGRLTFGSTRAKLLAEVSNAKNSSITASQRAFTQAIGLDYKVRKALWLSLRFGKQRTIKGDDDEVGSLFSVSYSPTELLKF